jgi:hypothetical protein
MNAARPYPANVKPMPARPETFIPAALDDAGLDVHAFRLFCRICRRWDAARGCDESVPNMAKACRMKGDTAWVALRELEARGMVRRTSRPGQTTRLDPMPASQWKAAPEEVPTHPPKRGTPPSGVPPETGGGVPPETGYKGYPLKDIPRGVSRTREEAPPVEDIWDEFWEAYPVKRSKQPALKRWKALGLHRDPERAREILADVERRKTQDSQWQRGFAPHPSTYLNQERWTDELESPTPQADRPSGSNGPRRPRDYDPAEAHARISRITRATLGLEP